MGVNILTLLLKATIYHQQESETASWAYLHLDIALPVPTNVVHTWRECKTYSILQKEAFTAQPLPQQCIIYFTLEYCWYTELPLSFYCLACVKCAHWYWIYCLWWHSRSCEWCVKWMQLAIRSMNSFYTLKLILMISVMYIYICTDLLAGNVCIGFYVHHIIEPTEQLSTCLLYILLCILSVYTNRARPGYLD